jgi:hypothetical protein
MRFGLLVLPLSIAASPALAQQAPPPAVPDTIQLPPELTDPKWADRLTDAMVAMSKVFLELPIGEVEAAIEGRQPTTADKRRTVRSETKMSEREIRQQIEEARPAMQAGTKALAAALPAIMKGMAEAQREIERATANMPRPDYPRR